MKGLKYSVVFAAMSACAVPLVGGLDGGDAGHLDVDAGPRDAGASTLKALPSGVYESGAPVRTAGEDSVGHTVNIAGQEGVLVRVPWGLCGDDETCLFDTVKTNLDSASSHGLKVALAISDGDSIPPGVRSRCATFGFVFDGVARTMCLPWDANYLAAKRSFVERLGARFDSHPALGYVYFTGACTTNGFEGHCRIDEAAYGAAGYEQPKLTDAYRQIMSSYVSAFPTTPIAVEVHALFGSAATWSAVWADVKASGRVGLAAWWCAERMSVRGADTTPVWSILRESAAGSFAVCQTIGKISAEPWRFSDSTLGLDYGSEGAFDANDSMKAFTDTLDWLSGVSSHAGQGPIAPFAVIEAWTADLKYSAYQQRLGTFPQ